MSRKEPQVKVVLTVGGLHLHTTSSLSSFVYRVIRGGGGGEGDLPREQPLESD